MSSMAVLCITGRLGKDAELKYTANEKTVLKFSVAVDTGWGDNKVTTWYNCDLWGKQAESLQQFLLKGKMVGVSGQPSLREYTNDSGKQKSLDVRVDSVTLLGGKNDQDDSTPF